MFAFFSRLEKCKQHASQRIGLFQYTYFFPVAVYGSLTSSLRLHQLLNNEYGTDFHKLFIIQGVSKNLTSFDMQILQELHSRIK